MTATTTASEATLDRALIARALSYSEHGARTMWLGQPVAAVADRIRAGRTPFPVPSDAVDLARRDVDLLAAVGGRLVTRDDPEWPRLQLAPLDRTPSPSPFALYVRGPARLDVTAGHAITVTGTRTPTSYGRTVTTTLVAELAQFGWNIAASSGYGIAATAHRAALTHQATPVAVLPCGLDIAHPPGNADLLAAIADTGLLISPYPPGTRVTRARRRAHARLLSALCAGVVVIESAHAGEPATTAATAIRVRTPVFAVPGPVTSATSRLPHQLLADGHARLVTSGRDIHHWFD
ncbi:DNA-processing protein DprA [Nocardia mexicana]|uniref:DNA protecting protein DprA n=1 Tax=Nocardia mexicana TaxID=279262 RepID=A0A370GS37_9NOCA|nr:DNA-processing protein DprA [Nocardia mexicana]RDI45314.1 DNA protecting protein DprA [Nocardia mexicana]